MEIEKKNFGLHTDNNNNNSLIRHTMLLCSSYVAIQALHNVVICMSHRAIQAIHNVVICMSHRAILGIIVLPVTRDVHTDAWVCVRVNVCVCMWTRAHVCVSESGMQLYSCVVVSVYVCVPVSMCVHMCVYACVCMYAPVSLYVHACVCMCVCVRVCMSRCLFIIYNYTYIRTYFLLIDLVLHRHNVYTINTYTIFSRL